MALYESHGSKFGKMPLLNDRDIFNESIELSKETLLGEAQQKILVIVIDKGLNFQSHTKAVIKTVNQELSARIRVAPFKTDFNKKVMFHSLLKASSIIVPYSGCLTLEL